MNRSKKLLPVMSLFFVLTMLGWFGGSSFVSTQRSVFAPPSAHAAETKYTCGMHPMIITEEPGLCPICNMELTPLKAGTGGAAEKPKGERKIKYWVAPMDPTYIREEPGKSPMGMDLVPVYEGDEPGGPVISVDPVTAQNMGIRTARVEKKDLTRSVRTVGLVDFDESKQYSINAKIDGWVERLHVNETWARVEKGQPLLEIYSPELVAAQEEYLLALNNNEELSSSAFPEIGNGARRLLDASRKRLEYWDISERQIEKLERTRKVRKTLTLYAPYNGVVTRKGLHEGMYVKSGMELFQLSDLSNIWVLADIYEYELPWLQVNQRAQIKLPYIDARPLEGTVTYIYPVVDDKTRTVKARLEFANPDDELRPDMYVNVHLAARTVENALVVPVQAVIHSGERRTVFVALGDGKFEPRSVKLGLRGAEGLVQIEQGLMEGEKVVTSAQFMLDSESQLREAIQKMMEPDQPEQAGDHEMDEESMDDLFGSDSAGSDTKPEEELDGLF